jgi:hypothetical protein
MPFDRKVQIDIVRGNSLIALRVEGLKVVFDVSKDVKASANTATIRIYNLAPQTRNERFQDLKDRVIIRAGYADESLDEIFHGDVVDYSHPRDGANVVTTIVANDGQSALRNSYSSVSYGQGASLKQILKDATRELGLPSKSEDWLKVLGDQKFLQGFAFSGPTQALLDKVTARAGAEWSVQGNQLQILKKGGVVPMDLSLIPLVSPDHGLIGSPERLQLARDESPEKKPPGWRIKSSLIGRLEPGGQIGLQCADVPQAKAFRIEAVQHHGDTHGDDFYSLTEALDPGVLISGVK